MAEKEKSKNWVVALVVVLIVLAAIALFYRNEIQAWLNKKAPTQPGNPQATQTNTNTNTQTNTSTQTATINYNKLLKQGVTGVEVEILQGRLLVDQDGNFGPQTKAALQAKKGVDEITLNTYDTTDDVSWYSGWSWFGMNVQSPFANKYGTLDDGFSISPELLSGGLPNSSSVQTV